MNKDIKKNVKNKNKKKINYFKVIILWLISAYFLTFFVWIPFIYYKDWAMGCMSVYAYKLNHNITNHNCLYVIDDKYNHIDDCNIFNNINKKIVNVKKVWYANWCNMNTTSWWVVNIISDIFNHNVCIGDRIYIKLFNIDIPKMFDININE